jgi:methylthioribose-1-phosphate isomerase
MRINGRSTRTIWPAADGSGDVEILDQTRLPHAVEVARLSSLGDAAKAIRVMQVRGAPLIGAAAAYGVCLALRDDPSDAGLDGAIQSLLATRPTAVNLAWALARMEEAVRPLRPPSRFETAWRRAAEICDQDVETCRRIGEHGLELIRNAVPKRADGVVKVLTHCNAGWLATVDLGTALAPIYLAQ